MRERNLSLVCQPLKISQCGTKQGDGSLSGDLPSLKPVGNGFNPVDRFRDQTARLTFKQRQRMKHAKACVKSRQWFAVTHHCSFQT